MGQGGFGAYPKPKKTSQFMQTKCLCHKKSQNTPIFPVSYYSDCIEYSIRNEFKSLSNKIVSVKQFQTGHCQHFIIMPKVE